MASQSFYRKWRSQTFADVVGQPHVTRTLRNALNMGRIAHAYLFCGPRGVGKTSVARILAKAINCPDRHDGEPCNVCSMCHAITEGRALDVIEVDAASNRRIEEMRDLRDKVNFAPSEGKYKVYILDEAHMLTSEASNALLKTLEEPPAHTVFVLVTTEAHKIQETIVSRCQRLNFRRIPSRETVERLNHLCQTEGLVVAPEALGLIARAATGSLRDAEGLLDQLVAYCGPEISTELAAEILGLAGDESIRGLARHVSDRDLTAALALVNELADSGIDLRRFAEGFVGHLRGALMLKASAPASILQDVAANTLESMRLIGQEMSLDQLAFLIRSFSEAEQGSRGALAPQVALELAVVESILHLGRQQAPAPQQNVDRSGLAAPATDVTGTRGKPAELPGRVARVVPPRVALHLGAASEGSSGTTKPDIAQSSTQLSPTAGRAGAGAGAPPMQTRSENGKVDANSGPVDLGEALAELRKRWKKDIVGSALLAKTGGLQAILRDCDPYAVRDGTIVIGCEYPFHLQRLSEIENLRLLEKSVADVVGGRVPLRLEIVPRSRRGQPPPVSSDPLIKEVLSWGGRIKAVVPDPSAAGQDRSPSPPGDEEVAAPSREHDEGIDNES